MVLRIAHFASFNRVGSSEQLFGVALLGHESGQLDALFVGLVQLIMLPDVSMASMKYGFDDAGHCDGSELRHAAL
jgi:hypothetical protein